MSKQKQINFKISLEEFEKVEAITKWRIDKGVSSSVSDFAKQCFFAALDATVEKPILMLLPENSEIEKKQNNINDIISATEIEESEIEEN